MPRLVTLTALAGRLHIARSTLSETLARGERRLLDALDEAAPTTRPRQRRGPQRGDPHERSNRKAREIGTQAAIHEGGQATMPTHPRGPRAHPSRADIHASEHRVERPPTKELRVRISAAHVARLHAHRLLRNKSMSETIEAALERYFASERFPDVPTDVSREGRARS